MFDDPNVQEILELARSRINLPGPAAHDGARYVRTPEGSKKYGLPIGARITADAIKRATKRFPGVDAPEDKGGSSGSAQSGPKAPKTPQAKKTASQIAKVLNDSPELKNPKFVRPKGDKKVLVGQHVVDVPSGSRVFRSKDSDKWILIRKPDYDLLLVTNKGFAIDLRGDTENELNDRFDDIDVNDKEFSFEDIGDLPDTDGDGKTADDGSEEESLASELDTMSSEAETAGDTKKAQAYKQLAEQMHQESTKKKTAAAEKAKTDSENESGAPDSAVSPEASPSESETAAPEKAKSPRRAAEKPRSTVDVAPEDLTDEELDDVLADLDAAVDIYGDGVNPALGLRVKALHDEKDRRSGKKSKPEAPVAQDAVGVRDEDTSTDEPAADLEESPKPKTPSTDPGQKFTTDEFNALGLEGGKGEFTSEVSDRDELLDAKVGDKFLLSNPAGNSLWGVEEDGKIHQISNENLDGFSMSLSEFADLQGVSPIYGKTDIHSFKGNKDNQNSHPTPKAGDAVSQSMLDEAEPGFVPQDGTGIVGEKNENGTYDTALGEVGPEFFSPSDVEDDETVVVRPGPDPEGKPLGATTSISSPDDLAGVSVGDSVVAVGVGDGPDITFEKISDNKWQVDVNGLKLDFSDEDLATAVSLNSHQYWNVPNQDLAGQTSQTDWKEGDTLQTLDDLLAQKPGTKLKYQYKSPKLDGKDSSVYTVLPDGEVQTESGTVLPTWKLKKSVAGGQVSVLSTKADDMEAPSVPAKEIKSVSDYVDGDQIVDYKHLKDMKKGQQATILVPSSKNGGKAVSVVLTRTDDTMDNQGWMFMVGKKGAGYNSFGENNASLMQAIFDGRLYFGDITQMPDSPKAEVMDGDWSTEKDISLWDGGPLVSEKDLRDFINAQIYSRAMQGSYYNTDLLPLDSPFRAQWVRAQLSEKAIDKYSIKNDVGQITNPARHKPSMIRYASELLGLEYTDPGAALIPDDLELSDFKEKVSIGKQWGKSGVAKDELEKMGAETIEVTKADIKTALAALDNMLTSNQEEALLKELGLSTKDSSPDKILKRVFAMRGSSLQDLNTSAAVAAYFGYQRYRWNPETKKWVKSTAIAKQHDKTRNKQLLRQMLLEQLEGREPGYYGMPEDEMYHWVTEGGVDKGWYLNRTSMTPPGESAPMPTPGTVTTGSPSAVVDEPDTPEIQRDEDDYPLTGHPSSGGREITPEQLFAANPGEKFELGTGDDTFTVHMGDDGHLVDEADGFVYQDWDSQNLPGVMKIRQIPGETYADPSPVDDGTGIVQIEAPVEQPDWFDTIDLSTQILPEDQLGQSGNGFVVIQPSNGGKPFSRWGKFGASGIAVVSTDEDGVKRVLVGKRGDRDEWYLPGGAKDENESAIQGALREFVEEIDGGEDLVKQMKLTSVHGTSAGQIVASGTGAHSGYWVYSTIVTSIEGVPAITVKPGSEQWELQNFEWKTLEELDELELSGQLHKGLANGNLARMAGMKDGPVEASASSLSFNEPDNLADPSYDITDWHKVGGSQGGSNSGGVYEDSDGNKYYVKKSNGGSEAAHNEVVASALYDALGVYSNKVRLGKRNGDSTTYVVTPWIDNDGQALPKAVQSGDTEFLKKVQEDFAIDAWLANYDVIGIGPWNLVAAHDGTPIRIDPGASMLFRATGGKKSWWSGNPTDIDDMRFGTGQSSAYSYLPNVFGSMTDEDVAESAKKLLKISPDQISAIVNSSGFDDATKKQLADTLITRRKKILDRFGITDTTDNPALDAMGIIQTHATEGTPKFEVDSAVKLKKTGQVVTVKFSNNEMSWGVDEDGLPVIAMNEEWAHPDEDFESPVGDYSFSNGDRTFSVNEAVQVANPQLGTFAQGKILDADITSGDVQVVLDGEDSPFWTHKDNVAKVPSAGSGVEASDFSKLPETHTHQPPDGSTIIGEWLDSGISAVEHPDGSIFYYYPDDTPVFVEKGARAKELKKQISESFSMWNPVNPTGEKTGVPDVSGNESESSWASSLAFTPTYVPEAGDKIYTYSSNPFADPKKAYVVKPSGDVLRVDPVYPQGKILEGTAAFNVKAQLSGTTLHPDYKQVYGDAGAPKATLTAPTSLPSGFKPLKTGSKIIAYNKGSNSYVVEHPDGTIHFYYEDGDTMQAGDSFTMDHLESLPNVYDIYPEPEGSSQSPAASWPEALDWTPNYTPQEGDEIYWTLTSNVSFAAVGVKHSDGTFTIFHEDKLNGYKENSQAVQGWIDSGILKPADTPAPTPAPALPSWLDFDPGFVPITGDQLWMNEGATAVMVVHPDGSATHLSQTHPNGEFLPAATVDAAKKNGLWQQIDSGHTLALAKGYTQPPAGAKVLAHYGDVYAVEHSDGSLHTHYPSGYVNPTSVTKDELATNPDWDWDDASAPQAVVSANVGPKDQFGKQLAVGDKVRVAKFNKAGQSPYGVIKSVNPNTGKIRIQRTDEHGHPIVQNGKFVYTNHDGGNLHKQAAVPKSEGGLPTGVTLGKGDPDSPLYGAEAPKPPEAPQASAPTATPPTLGVDTAKQSLPDTWAVRADTAYAVYRSKKNLTPVNKTWSDSSTAAGLINGALTGQGNYLDQIKAKGYFDEDPDLYDEIAQAAAAFLKIKADHENTWAEKVEALKAEYDATMAKYEAQQAAWQIEQAAWIDANGGAWYTPMSPDDPSIKKLSDSAAQSWMKSKYKPLMSKLTSSQKHGLSVQKQSSSWQTSIRKLPAGLGLRREDVAGHPDVAPSSMKTWDEIRDAAENLGPVGEAWQAIRTISIDRLVGSDGKPLSAGSDLTQIVGTIQKDHGAMEVVPGSIEHGGKAATFYDVYMDLTFPPEVKGVYTGISGQGFSYHEEHGFIAEPGLAMYISGVKKVNGHWRVQASVIPREVLPYMNNFEGAPTSHNILPNGSTGFSSVPATSSDLSQQVVAMKAKYDAAMAKYQALGTHDAQQVADELKAEYETLMAKYAAQKPEQVTT